MIKKINPKNFAEYGWIIDYPSKNSQAKKKNLFRIVVEESEELGWRIAYLVVRDKSISRLEQHGNTFESFEPVNGRCLLYLAKDKDPDAIDCFYLDKPVILKKGIWHGVITLDGEAEIKITENAKVKSRYWPLSFRLNHSPTAIK